MLTRKMLKQPTIARKSENGFYQQFKAAVKKLDRKIKLTRLECWVGAGTPDVLVYDEAGTFHFVELKYTETNKVYFEPSQVSWHARHQDGPVWVFVKQRKKDGTSDCLVYPAKSVIQLATDGIKKTKPALVCAEPFDWDKILQLTCPS